jgi:fatty-acyl-CoA synthase
MTPDRIAIAFGDTEYRYAELAERVARLAGGLRGLGVRPGDRVAYLGPNHPAYLETLFAVGAVGAVFVPINFRLSAPEVRYVLADSGAGLLIHGPAQSALVDALDEAVAPQRISTDSAAYRALLSAAPQEDEVPITLDDPALIMYTSGSTGQPKGAVLTHGNLTWNCLNVLVETDLAGDEVTLVTAPLFHAAALGMTCLPTLLKGATVVLHESFDPAAVFAEIARRRVTFMFGVPTMYQALADHPGWADADLSSVRNLSCGGSPVPTETIRRYLARGLVFVQGYGMTEVSPGALYLDRAHVTSKVGSAGVPSFFTDVRVVTEDMTPVAVGEKGEVVVSGPNVMAGYWGREADTAAAVRDGWFHSGDVATVDGDGYVFIVDRMKDMIISGGENVYPAEVESVLYQHSAVALCAVIGAPDEKWGEVGRAVVVLREGAAVSCEELLDFARDRLARFKVPKYVEFVTELPITGSGKILKSQLRERFRS